MMEDGLLATINPAPSCRHPAPHSSHLQSAPSGKLPTVAIPAVGALLAVLLIPVGVAAAPDSLDFRARASADQEVADPDSPGLANGRFRFNQRLFQLFARANVAGLTGEVAASHLHCAPAGQDGPIVVNLQPTTGVTQGLIVNDRFTNDDIEAAGSAEDGCVATCGFEITNIASLRSAAASGCIYLNVHTSTQPGGEVRGQLLAE